MHSKEELDKAIMDLYHDYKETYKDYKEGNIRILFDFNKISNEEKKYTKDEVYYIGLNALALLEQDIRNNKI